MSRDTRFIFVTGGVVSSLGKGIAAASLGALLRSRGLDISMVKLDPYINVDPGTMSPYQHGEVFVTHDGAETDLDLGHYERFAGIFTNKDSNFTTGRIYQEVILKEREGAYLGSTVQVVPHITDHIKESIRRGAGDADVCLIEIGGTVGDIESQPFLEAIRQMALDLPEMCFFLHLTLAPELIGGEVKTKPTQHSVKELRSIGLQPDALLVRCSRPLGTDFRLKIAMFTNVPASAVVTGVDVDDIHRIPGILHDQGLDETIVRKLGLKCGDADLSMWKGFDEASRKATHRIRVAMVGKYVKLKDAYISLHEALSDAGTNCQTKVEIVYVDCEDIEKHGVGGLDGCDAVLVPGGFGNRGIDGKIKAIEHARTHQVPFLGICLGMQLAIVEIARNVLGLSRANSTEFDPSTSDPVVGLVSDWLDLKKGAQHRSKISDLGGTMRLGAQDIVLDPGSLIYSLYAKEQIQERHRHRYEFNSKYLGTFQKAGVHFSGKSKAEQLVEVIEIPAHPWFVATQYHPEFTSTPKDGHPLFKGFVLAARRYASLNRG